jgi:hypothetical protein
LKTRPMRIVPVINASRHLIQWHFFGRFIPSAECEFWCFRKLPGLWTNGLLPLIAAHSHSVDDWKQRSLIRVNKRYNRPRLKRPLTIERRPLTASTTVIGKPFQFSKRCESVSPESLAMPWP